VWCEIGTAGRAFFALALGFRILFRMQHKLEFKSKEIQNERTELAEELFCDHIKMHGKSI
jgi:hypothetical protein